MTPIRIRRPPLERLALFALLAAACRPTAPQSAGGAGALPVTVSAANVVVAEVRILKSGPPISGTLTAEHQATLRAEVAGNVTSVEAEQGQSVGRETVLARIDDTELQDRLLSARSAVRSAESNQAVATRDAERADKLLAAGAVAEQDREIAQRNLANAEAALADARARLVAAQRQVDRAEIRAPFSGIISERTVHTGDIVQVGNPLFTLVDPASLRLEASVAVAALDQLKVGSEVEFTVTGYDGQPFTGRIARINPSVDPATRQVRLIVTVPNAGGRLITGMFAEGRVASASRRGVVVPAAAVDRRGLSPYVVRVQAGKVERVDVELGMIDEVHEQMEILRGLNGGDTLLLGGARGITPGTAVVVSGKAEAHGSNAESQGAGVVGEKP